MRIHSCETFAVKVNFEGLMSGTHIVARLRTTSGPEGISYISRVTPENAGPLRSLIAAMTERLKGLDALDTEALYATLHRPVLGASLCGLELRAASALDVAAWDIKGKALGLPVFRLLGGARARVPVSANWHLMPGSDPAALARHIENLLHRGFRALKCPVGLAPMTAAIAHVRLVRECAGPDVKIIVDGNFNWTVKEAQHFARETENCDLYWIEDPVASHDQAGLREITHSIRQRTCAGECFQHTHEFRRLLTDRCADNIMIDQDLGLTGFMHVAHMAHIHDTPVINHLAPEVLSHGIAAVPNGLIVGLVPWGQPLFTEPLKIENGELVMSQLPGLGLCLDEDVLTSPATPL
jgi:L-alanine-DL-glutamate epimerase-like enolase superfamily enzyme